MLFSACREYVPKPHGYPRIEFPEKKFQTAITNCPFSFDIPIYTQLIPDTGNLTEPCWYNLYYPDFDATLHLSYKHYSNVSQLDSMMEDAYQLVFKHTIKAEDIVEKEFENKQGCKGVYYAISGNTATPVNFYLSDNKHHFLRGAFYFNNHTERDSVLPVVQFVEDDVWKLINSTVFRK